MKLVELRIKNFRAIGSGEDGEGLCVKIDENNIIFLIGKNNAGKSSILNSYDYFVNENSAKSDDFYNKKCLPIEIEVKLRAEGQDEARQLKLLPDYLDLENDNEIRVKKEWSFDQPSKCQKYIWTQDDWEILDENDSKHKKAIKQFNDFLKRELPNPIWIRGMSTPDEMIGKIKRLIKEAVLKSLTNTAEYKDAEKSLRNLQNLVSKSPYADKLKDSINEVIQKIFPSVSLAVSNESEEIDLIKLIEGFTQIQAIEDGKESISLDWQGHGVQRHFVFSAYKECHRPLDAISSKTKKSLEDLEIGSHKGIKKTNILLIEEPELFLHPTAIRSIRDLLYELANESNFQIFCATHSPIMIDLSQPQNSLVRVVKDKNYGSVCYQVSENLKDIRILEVFNSHTCEAFFADKVLLVEGNTEAVVIRLLLEKFKKEAESQKALEDIHVVVCNGKTTIPYFQEVLTHFKIDHFVFHDSDAEFSKEGTRLNVWTINERIWERIENARRLGLRGVRRFVSIPDFETANGYSPLPKGKPIEAYMQAQKWLQRWDEPETQQKAIVRYLSEVIYEEGLEDHTQIWITKNCETNSISSDFLDEQLSLFDD